MAYYRDLDAISLAEYQAILEGADLLPSRRDVTGGHCGAVRGIAEGAGLWRPCGGCFRRALKTKDQITGLCAGEWAG